MVEQYRGFHEVVAMLFCIESHPGGNNYYRGDCMGWDGWSFARVVLVFCAAAFLLTFIQVTLNHYRQNFRDLSQWIPVLALPILALGSLIVAAWNGTGARSVLTVLCWIGVGVGLIGFYKHLRGVGERVDGYRLHNFLVGPPIILPLFISAVSALALLALYWS